MKRSLLPLFLAGTVHVIDAQQPTFSARADLVYVDVLVTDGTEIVRNLTAKDFEVRDNGVRQQIEFVSIDSRPINVTLTLDMSQSVAGIRLTRLREAVAAVLDSMAAGDRVSLLTFSHIVANRAALTSNVSLVREALASVAPSGPTALVDATYATLTAASPADSRTLAIVFSDGLDTASWLTAESVLAAAKRSPVVIYGVDARQRGSSFLQGVASETGGRLIQLTWLDALRELFVELLTEFRFRYLIGYVPKGVASSGWHELDVRVRGRGTVKARRGYERKISSAAR